MESHVILKDGQHGKNEETEARSSPETPSRPSSSRSSSEIGKKKKSSYCMGGGVCD